MTRKNDSLLTNRGSNALKKVVGFGDLTKIKSTRKINLRKLAWAYCIDVLQEITNDRSSEKRELFRDIRQRENENIEALRGPGKFLPDTKLIVYLPEYIKKLPESPEMGYEYVVFHKDYDNETDHWVDDSSSSYYLWYDGCWARVNTAIMRDLNNSGIRTAFFDAIRSQSSEIMKDLPTSALAIATWSFHENQYYGALSS